MKYLIARQSGKVFAEGIAEDRIEETLRSGSQPSDSIFIIAAQLPTSFNARVLRSLGKPETIEVECNGEIIYLSRDTIDQKGDINVSCDPIGAVVTVDTFNIHFCGYEDNFTDRGIVWVCPGNPASIQLVIKREALEIPGMVQKIIEEAKSALADKLLDRLDLASL